ncbi:hypothetical protein [Streptomyces sp. ITFR-6]|uniref:hypothetical protein n=1 Tax=Streptomyces sp. ITFR-6 TaxID=3075197 RepID=UPI002889B021|nr:hypothetical protein [Streptomyces sp. ITFR-6]WNI30868.1 hypothetical protein RLT59_20355 [Streptomyces sp. ITFR-6]
MPSKPVRREADGSLAIDLWFRREGAFEADASLRLTPAEAETLHAQLCYALDDDTAALVSPAGSLPDCRKSILTTRRQV